MRSGTGPPRGPRGAPADVVPDVHDLRHELVPQRDGRRHRELAADDVGVEIAERHRERPDERLARSLERRLRSVGPLDPSRLDECQLLHRPPLLSVGSSADVTPFTNLARDGRRAGDSLAAHDQGLRPAARRSGHADGAAGAGPVGAEPPSHEPVALPGRRARARSSASNERPASSRWPSAARRGRGRGGRAQLQQSSTGRPRWSCARCVRSEDPIEREEDSHAAAVAAYIVLLAAHGRGLAGYWRTPAVLRTEAGRAGRRAARTERTSSACSTSGGQSRTRRRPTVSRPPST